MSSGIVDKLLKTIDVGLADLSEENVGTVLKALDGFQQEPLILIHRGVLTKWTQSLCNGFFDTGSADESSRLARCQVFYTISKVVTWKRIVSYLPTDVYLLRELIPLLNSEIEDDWYMQFFVLSWLYVLCLSPFKLEIGQQIYRLVSKFKGAPSVSPIVVKIQAQLLINDGDFFKLIKDELDLSTGVRVIKLSLNREEPVVDKQTLDRFTSMCLGGETDASRLKMLPKLFQMQLFYGDTDALEDILSWILSRLSNEFTETRFALAHSYAKIVKAMIADLEDRETAQELIESCLNSTVQLFEEVPWGIVDRNLLHTNLLIIAELSNTIIQNFPQYTLQIAESIVPHACRFQQLKMNTIQGTQIRDASNFICWSLARAKTTNQNHIRSSEYMTKVFLNVLMCSTFDHEILIRKSANAALQEILGRYVTFANLLDNAAILQILEMPITNPRKNFAANTIKLYDLFSNNKKRKFASFMLHWLFDYCVMANYDLSVVQLTTNAMCLLISEKPTALNVTGLEKKITCMVPSTVQGATRLLYLLVHLEYRGLISSSESLDAAFNKVAESVDCKRFTKNPFELFKYVAILEYLTLMLQNRETFCLSLDDVSLIFHAIRGFSDTMTFFNDIVHSLREILPILSTSADRFASEAVQMQFWGNFEQLIGSNNSVVCSAFSVVEARLFSRMFHGKLPVMDCLRKSQVLESLRDNFNLQNIVAYTGNEILFTIAKLLNDYTITEQGDVGRLVRASACKLIEDYHDLFLKDELAELVVSDLVRLCGEPNKEIRQVCFTILQRCKGVEKGIHQQINSSYLLSFQHLHLQGHSKQFWRGYLMSAGAIHSTESEIRESIDSFLVYYSSLSQDSERLELCNELVRIIPSAKTIMEYKNQTRHNPVTGGRKPDIIKITVTYLLFWHRVMESGLKIHATFNFQGFYAKLYNLHLLNADLLRVNALALFPFVVICHAHAKGKPDKLFVNPIIRRLLTIAKREAEKSMAAPTFLQQNCINFLATIFLELGLLTHLKYVAQCGDDSDKLLALSESKLILE
ncbi:uncharacterized protein ZBAI_04934 [Zygosaccharomyces bailii ISA1307]|nr:uncharacterized protein ZBAI_04934 [Zygosaccharomyces bailii ISA1307]